MMSLVFKWVIIYMIWLGVTGCMLFSIIWFITGSHLIMEWHIIGRVAFGLIAALCAATMTAITSDVEDSTTRIHQLNAKLSEIEPR